MENHPIMANMEELDATQIRTPNEAVRALALSGENLVVFYKHSPICGASDRAIREVARFRKEVPGTGPLFFIDVIAGREASLEVEELTGIRHESPQVLFIQDGKCVWSTSHGKIKVETMKAALPSGLGPLYAR